MTNLADDGTIAMAMVAVQEGMRVAIALPEEKRTIFGEVEGVYPCGIVVGCMLGEFMFDPSTGEELNQTQYKGRASARIIMDEEKARAQLLGPKN